MTEVSRRYRLHVDSQVHADLRRVKAEDKFAHAQIIAFFQELQNDILLCESLIDEHFSGESIESIEPFWAMQSDRKNVYRIRLFDVGSWRILTAGDHQKKEVAILAIMHRSQDYQSDIELMGRLEESYEKFGFGDLGR